jgi:soluble lytic murein transglycosylase
MTDVMLLEPRRPPRAPRRLRAVLGLVALGLAPVVLAGSGAPAGAGTPPALPTAPPPATGTTATATRAAGAEPDPDAALRTARVALDAGDTAVALAALEASLPGLEDHRALLRGQALWRAGRAAEAVAAVRAIGPEPREAVPCKPDCKHPLWIPATELAAAALAATDPAGAAERLLRLPPDGARWARAVEALRAAKSEAEAVALEDRLLTELPATPEARSLADALGVEAVHARLGTARRVEQRLWALLEAHDNARARDEARLELERRRGDRCALRYVEGKSSRKLRRYAESIRALRSARQACAPKTGKPRSLWFRSALLEAQVQGIRRNVAGVARMAEDIAGADPSHSYVDDALFHHADTLDRRGRFEEAEAVYRRIVERHGDGDQVALAAWRLALRRIQAGDFAAARPWLERLRDAAGPTDRDRARARYWLARGLEPEDRAAALAGYRQAMREPALSFYGWLALDRMAQLDPKAAAAEAAALLAARDATPAPERPERRRLDSVPAVLRARRLARVGWTEAAVAELALLEHPKLGAGEAVALALVYAELGGFAEAQWLLRAKAAAPLARFPSGGDLEVWRAAYSRPFRPELEAAAKAARIEPLALFALSREESTFDPEIVSWAGAIGLSQLMPGTAIGAYADVYRKRLEDTSILTDPALNLRLGAHVLASGFRRFGHFPLALAAYNGGPGLAFKTLPAEQAVPFDLWVEAIPVQETRRYVKRVVGTWGAYRFLYDTEAPIVDLPDTVTPRGGAAPSGRY